MKYRELEKASFDNTEESFFFEIFRRISAEFVRPSVTFLSMNLNILNNLKISSAYPVKEENHVNNI